MWRDVIKLGKWTESIVYGEPIRTLTWTEVFANKKSVRQSEFYSAANVGLKPEIVFEVRSVELDGHDKVEFSGKEYSLIRTYDKGEITELVCSAQVGDLSG